MFSLQPLWSLQPLQSLQPLRSLQLLQLQSLQHSNCRYSRYIFKRYSACKA